VDGFAGDVDVLEGDSAFGGVGDREVAQQLLDGVRDDAGVVGVADDQLPHTLLE
jgi:hypothetical protein